MESYISETVQDRS